MSETITDRKDLPPGKTQAELDLMTQGALGIMTKGLIQCIEKRCPDNLHSRECLIKLKGAYRDAINSMRPGQVQG